MRRAPLALRSRSSRRDRIAWAVALVLVPLVVVGTKAWLERPVALASTETVPHTRDFRMPVLAYGRVDSGPGEGHLDAERLAEHLASLEAAGFHPVTLRQVHDAYLRGAPLPARPILLTFDGGHLSTHRSVDPLLRRTGWPAVMLVDARLAEERHSTYVYWDRLRRMVRSGVWELGATAAFPEARDLVARRVGHELLAGVAGDREGGAGEGPPLAFEDTLFGVNDATADPLRLARLRVPHDWSGDQLVERLAFSAEAPSPDVSGDPVHVPPRRWVAAGGTLETSESTVTVSGAPRAEAWIAGSEWAQDFVLEADVRPEGGPFWVVQQRVGSRDQWRWGGTSRALYLQRLRPGEPVEVIARAERTTHAGDWHTLRVVKRGEGVWVEWDGARVAEMPRSVGARWRGHVGITVGGPSEPGGATVRDVRFATIPWELRAVSASPGAEEVQALLGESSRVAAISPPGLVQQGGILARRAVDERLLAMLAAHGAWEIVPTVELVDGRFLRDEGRAAAVAELAGREGWTGVRLLFRPLGGGDRVGPEVWQRAFEAKGLRLVPEPQTPHAGAAR